MVTSWINYCNCLLFCFPTPTPDSILIYPKCYSGNDLTGSPSPVSPNLINQLQELLDLAFKPLHNFIPNSHFLVYPSVLGSSYYPACFFHFSHAALLPTPFIDFLLVSPLSLLLFMLLQHRHSCEPKKSPGLHSNVSLKHFKHDSPSSCTTCSHCADLPRLIFSWRTGEFISSSVLLRL